MPPPVRSGLARQEPGQGNDFPFRTTFQGETGSCGMQLHGVLRRALGRGWRNEGQSYTRRLAQVPTEAEVLTHSAVLARPSHPTSPRYPASMLR